LRHAGLDLVRFEPTGHPDAKLKWLLEARGVDLALDVGANAGQFGLALRRLGYRGRILSFEPMSSAFAVLERRAVADGNWQAQRLALGDAEGTATLHVAGNSWSSSLLGMLPLHTKAAPDSAYVAEEQVRVTTLDAVLPGLAAQAGSILLKLDTQGYETRVLAGARQSLERVQCLHLEMSLAPLYEGEPVMCEMLARLEGMGFYLVGLEPRMWDRDTGRLLQVDGLLARMPAA
jgi:FkbM family methyltransferase